MRGMFEVYVKTHFSAAHSLKGYPGDCARVHGHNWVIEVFVQCKELDEIGIGIDFRDIKQTVNDVLEEHRGRLDMFQQLSCITTTEHDLDRLLEQALVSVNSTLDAESSSIMLCESDSLVVRACVRTNGDKDIVGTRQPRNAGIAGYVARLQQVLMVLDLHSDDRVDVTPGQEHKPPSFISVPILNRGRTLGVVNVVCKRNGLPRQSVGRGTRCGWRYR